MQPAAGANDILRGKGGKCVVLGLWMIATLVIAHSAHVILYDVVRVPDPDNTLAGSVPIFMNRALSVLAAMTFYTLGQTFFGRRRIFARCLLLAALWAMLNELLLRNFIMDSVVSHDLVYCFFENLPRPLSYLAGASLIVVLCQWSRSRPARYAGGLVIAALLVMLVDPLINAVFSRVVASIEFLDTGNIYNPPYGWQVDVPSYLTYAEPVIACYAVAALTWNRLSRRLAVRIGQFALLVMSMAGAIIPTLVYSFYQKSQLGIAVLSEGQFALQVLALSLMTALAWHVSGKHPRRTLDVDRA